jgi:hypothetical protein
MTPNDFEKLVFTTNNSPIDDFLELTPTEIHYLLYDPFGGNSVVQLQREISDAVLDQTPLFRIVEEYLRIIERDKYIKLTPMGALPKKVLVELYDKRILLDDHIECGIVKLTREHDWISLMSARMTLQIAGLVRQANGKIILTKKTEKLLAESNRQELFKQFFQVFTEKFLWSSNDGYPAEMLGQLGWAFSIYSIDKFGNQPMSCGFYAEKYLKAFPYFLGFFKDSYSTVAEQSSRCYAIRTFSRFLEWFGFVKFDQKKSRSELMSAEITRSGIFNSVFVIKKNYAK